MPDVIRHPCFDSALPGYAQHKRPTFALSVAERSRRAWPGAGNLDSCKSRNDGQLHSPLSDYAPLIRPTHRTNSTTAPPLPYNGP